MARLTKQEITQWKKRPRQTVRPPPPPLVSVRDYIEFATFAARFDRSVKPVRFTGNKWRL